MEQTRALNALEPFLALSKSATGPRAAADLITQATSNPNTYVFAELLSRPQIQSLSESPDHAPYLALLELFSYGTYDAYAAASAESGNSSKLPQLNDAQTLKLRQLSLLTLARNPRANLNYEALQRQLSLPDSRSLEDLVISAVYAGLLEAQLDPHNQTVHVSSVAPLRDLAPGSVPGMLTSLREWSDRCDTTLSDLESQMAQIRADAARRLAEKRAWEATQTKLTDKESGKSTAEQRDNAVHSRNQGNLVNRAVQRARFGKRGSDEANADDDDTDGGGGGGGGSGGGGDGAMDLDEEEDELVEGGGGKKRASRRKL